MEKVLYFRIDSLQKNGQHLSLALVLLIVSSNIWSVTLDEIKTKWKSPLEDEKSQTILAAGTGLTLLLVMNREGLIIPVQKAASEDKPLGGWANYGDTMGMSVPNALYAGGMYLHYKYTDSNQSLERAAYMFDATAYAGITTVILKRLVGQRRPNRGDNLSFPSGHTTTAVAFATTIAMEHEWYYAAAAILTAAITGYSRINDNAHYLHDVVFGATLGMAFGVSLKKFHKTSIEEEITLSPLFINEENFGLLLTHHF